VESRPNGISGESGTLLGANLQ
jgi:hypothetical protein